MQFPLRLVGIRSAMLAVALVGILTIAGCGGSSSSSSSTATTTPAFKPSGGTYNTSQTVTITDATGNAVLYCTTDGTTPTTSSPKCAQPTIVFKTEFLQAIAVAPGKAPSAVTSAGFTIDLSLAATPTLSPAGGTYTSTQQVTIADATTGANIYYTIDGSVPTPSSTLYTGPVTVSKNETLSAIATASGYGNSGVASATYAISPITAAPAFSPPGGTYTSAQAITITDATPGAAIYYTTNGNVPSATNGTLYAGPINVTATTTIQAVAIAPAYASSPVASATYTISLLPAATPTFSPGAGTYAAAQTVTIGDTTPSASIYYTTNDSVPSATNGTLYTAPIQVSSTQTVEAIAIAPGYTNSSVASALYTINLAASATPTFSPSPGAYTAAQAVTIGDTTTGAAIYYTTNDSVPSATNGTLYTAPIQVLSTETVEAIAIAPGYTNSAVGIALYTITPGSSTLIGTVSSGTLAVSGATVQLYAAGQTGYGSAATPLLSPAITTSSSGAFTFTYNCPAAPGDQLYVVATGGDTGGGQNSGIALMGALGACGSLPAKPQITVNEVTTVAAAYALAQFASPAASGPGIQVGAPAPSATCSSSAAATCNYTGLANAFKTPANLVDLGSGTALTITPSYKAAGGTPGGIINSSYVPQARIDSLADILASCINATASGADAACSSLFTAATPPKGTAPVDTLQAILSIAQNPGNNAAALYALAPSSAPFQPVLSSAPTDWTLALTFTGAGLGVVAGGDPGNGPSLSSMAIDAAGNIWMTANQACLNLNTFAAVDAIVEFDNQGNALSPDSTASNSYCGGYQPQFSGAPVLVFPQSIAVDLNGFVWAGNDPGSGGVDFTKLSGDGTVQQANYPGAKDQFNQPYCGGASGLAVDASNNLWAGCIGANGTGVGGISEISATDGSPIGGLSADGGSSLSNIGVISLDISGSLWAVVSPANNNGNTKQLYQVSDTTIPPVVSNDFSTSGNTFVGSVVADGVGNVFSLSVTPGTINALAADHKTFKSLTYPLPSGAIGMQLLTLDGAGNLWGVAYSGQVPLPGAFAGDALIPSYLVEMNSSGTILSPSATSIYGYTGTGGGGETQPILANHMGSAAYANAGLAVDGSGNLWIANTETPYTEFDTAVSPGQGLVEFIGVAVPVVTPASIALQNGQIGQRP